MGRVGWCSTGLQPSEGGILAKANILSLEMSFKKAFGVLLGLAFRGQNNFQYKTLQN